MNAAEDIIKHLLESEGEGAEDEDFDLKDVTEPGDEVVAGPTTVQRHGRMKVVDMPRYTFLISYLTPVAYYDKVFRTYYKTLKQWSPTTNGHINDWQGMIWKTPEWQKDEKNWEPSSVGDGHWVHYPRFKRVRQEKISKLFRELVHTMEMKPHLKRRMYHVDPKMRQGSMIGKQWVSGHLKHHDTGDEGLPRPDDSKYGKFFQDFDPAEPEIYNWQGSGYRSQEPYERGTPDEE